MRMSLQNLYDTAMQFHIQGCSACFLLIIKIIIILMAARPGTMSPVVPGNHLSISYHWSCHSWHPRSTSTLLTFSACTTHRPVKTLEQTVSVTDALVVERFSDFKKYCYVLTRHSANLCDLTALWLSEQWFYFRDPRPTVHHYIFGFSQAFIEETDDKGHTLSWVLYRTDQEKTFACNC